MPTNDNTAKKSQPLEGSRWNCKIIEGLSHFMEPVRAGIQLVCIIHNNHVSIEIFGHINKWFSYKAFSSISQTGWQQHGLFLPNTRCHFCKRESSIQNKTITISLQRIMSLTFALDRVLGLQVKLEFTTKTSWARDLKILHSSIVLSSPVKLVISYKGIKHRNGRHL